MDSTVHARCTLCAADLHLERPRTCPSCGRDGILDIVLGEEAFQGLSLKSVRDRALTLWRYRELLPLHPSTPVPHLPLGWTPVVRAPQLAARIGIADLFLKEEGRNPTGSLKDRGTAVALVRAREEGATTVAGASTGNAASSLACFAAASGMESVLFVPATIPEGKLGQLLVFGARVFRVRGTYEEAWGLCEQACEAYGWSEVSSAVNPFLLEGEKTAGLELAERFGEEMPEWIAVPVGDGSTIAAVWKGLLQAQQVGFLRDLPRLLGVQAEGASPVVEAFEYGREVTARPARTLADSIAVGRPRNGRQALAAVRASRGAMVAVSDVDLLVALRDTARLEGVFAETAAAASVAGLAEAVERGFISKGERAIALLTGTGLKDVRPVLRVTGEPIDVEPSLDAVRAAIPVGA